MPEAVQQEVNLTQKESTDTISQSDAAENSLSSHPVYLNPNPSSVRRST